MSKIKMTPSEALVEILVAEQVNTVFGIVGSAYTDVLDQVSRQIRPPHCRMNLKRGPGPEDQVLLWD
ncbi:MAG: hypothetical protein ACQEQ7_07915 [Thermodesulfobacteriota bacterium]